MPTTTEVSFPAFTFDLLEDEGFKAKFSDEAIRDQIDRNVTDFIPAVTEDEFVSEMAPYVDDPQALWDADDDDTDEARLLFRTAEEWGWETALTPGADDIRQCLTEAIEAVGGTEMYGVLTQVYWCGVLCSTPWADVCTDEDAVTAEVMAHAKVDDDGHQFTLGYGDTRFAGRLREVADEDGYPDDLGFGGNCEMECGVMARYVIEGACKLLESRLEGAENRVDARPHFRTLAAQWKADRT